MTDQPITTEHNSRDGLVQRARDMTIALKESPTRSLARIHHDEAIALDVARATLQQEYSYALDVLQAEEYATATPPPEDDGVFELPTDRDYDVRVLLVYVTGTSEGDACERAKRRSNWEDSGDVVDAYDAVEA